ncbi:MAG: N-6 DNA methylase [Dehalococcoidales bacterium]|nr:N-6 DNA methylase [Dehalococcoidales bacterium]
MANEAKTENLVREELRKQGYYDNPNIIVEEKKSDNPIIDKLLKYASKKGDGAGYPEFIIRNNQLSGFLIVIECKADTSKHQSDGLTHYAEYAVDGALLYGAHLAKQYDVLTIGVSGETLSKAKISHFLLIKGAGEKTSVHGDKILSFSDYYASYSQSPPKVNQDFKALAKYFKNLNALLYSKKIKEDERSLLISGILIALQNKAFRQGFKGHKTAQDLAQSIVGAIVEELSYAKLTKKRIENLAYRFSFIKTHTTLSTDKEFLETLVADIDGEINSFLKTYQYYDAIGQFYVEFLRYANNDKTLGIVLTPPHVTQLFAEVAGVTKDSVVIDNCCGTAGFLISAMKKMANDAKGDSRKLATIYNKQLVGIEFQDDIYALAVSNMIVHGDGKTNIYPGDCFTMTEDVKEFEPTVGLLNPPYKPPERIGKEVKEELEYVLNNLEMLEPNGTCVALIPLSCATAQTGLVLELKQELLRRHTLEAVMSMPEQLFHDSDVGVITCIMVFTAHIPHPQGKKTWFASWKDDNFVLVKNRGRIDKFNKWEQTRKEWVNTFSNREVIKGYSLMREVIASDEWCVEAYMETDYSQLKPEDFIEVVRNYMIYEFLRK